jgi:hypothetical protein
VLPLLPAQSTEARDIEAELERATLPEAQYSSMVRALLGNAT